jgi:Coenzyme PQQ synthesis protein D (PqqD)
LKLRAEALEWREVEGEVVALDVRASQYLAVNRTGAVLWPLLVAGTDREALVAAVLAEFEVDSATAQRDVDAFVAALREQDLLEPRPA